MNTIHFNQVGDDDLVQFLDTHSIDDSPTFSKPLTKREFYDRFIKEYVDEYEKEGTTFSDHDLWEYWNEMDLIFIFTIKNGEMFQIIQDEEEK